MHALPLPDASIDILTGGYALRNAPDLDRALAEITRVVKPGGHAAFLDFSKPANARAQRRCLWLLAAWGGFWGWLLHGNPEVYRYIAASLQRYPDRDALRRTLEGLGWQVLGIRRPFGGMLEILWLRRV